MDDTFETSREREVIQRHAAKEVSLGALPVARALPVRTRRLVGPWCFLDRFGPLTFGDEKPMDVAPHPHIGLQTVTWLVDGEIVHNDSLGCESVVRPGGVNVMTSGCGIAHTEQTPVQNSRRLDGVQLWVALPQASRMIAPSFESIETIPILHARGADIRVFSGSLGGVSSPARHHSELVGACAEVRRGEAVELALNPNYEHAVLLLGGDCSIAREPLLDKQLYYLGSGRSSLALSSRHDGRILLIGGPPFPESILMWWNFAARTAEEIAEARADWEERRRFGEVTAYHGRRLSAPSLVGFAQPNPAS